jgi:hypothetical protein
MNQVRNIDFLERCGIDKVAGRYTRSLFHPNKNGPTRKKLVVKIFII